MKRQRNFRKGLEDESGIQLAQEESGFDFSCVDFITDNQARQPENILNVSDQKKPAQHESDSESLSESKEEVLEEQEDLSFV